MLRGSKKATRKVGAAVAQCPLELVGIVGMLGFLVLLGFLVPLGTLVFLVLLGFLGILGTLQKLMPTRKLTPTSPSLSLHIRTAKRAGGNIRRGSCRDSPGGNLLPNRSFSVVIVLLRAAQSICVLRHRTPF